MGGKNFSSSGSGGCFGQRELSIGFTFSSLSFSSIGGDHASHEKIITASGELFWDFSFVFLIKRSSTNISGIEEISISLDEIII